MYSAEQQIIEALPHHIDIATLADLKEAIRGHLRETENQVVRLERIFEILHEPIREKKCEAMEGLLKEAKNIAKGIQESPALDAAIIGALQKVEHYEMASYGTLRSFAKHLDCESEIADLLQETLDEEGAADKKLTKIADGSLFTSGVNKKAASLAYKK
jgi:ferritin-like metal-binding protein YciE